MDLKGKLRKGLKIFGTDNREYGTIDRYDDQYAYVGKRQIPVSAFERMDNDRLYIGDQGRQYFETNDRAADRGQIRVPVREERLNVEKRRARWARWTSARTSRPSRSTSRSSFGMRK